MDRVLSTAGWVLFAITFVAFLYAAVRLKLKAAASDNGTPISGLLESRTSSSSISKSPSSRPSPTVAGSCRRDSKSGRRNANSAVGMLCWGAEFLAEPDRRTMPRNHSAVGRGMPEDKERGRLTRADGGEAATVCSLSPRLLLPYLAAIRFGV